jgi:hypothetical protein
MEEVFRVWTDFGGEYLLVFRKQGWNKDLGLYGDHTDLVFFPAQRSTFTVGFADILSP